MEDDHDKTYVGVVGLLIVVLVALLVGVLYWTPRAKADDYCDLWAREQSRIDITTSGDFTTLTSTQLMILKKKAENLLVCRAMEMKPQLEGDNSDEAWSLSVYQILIQKAQAYADGVGVEPATEKPVAKGDDQWKEQCRVEYKTWDENTGTVVRRGSSERVRCPCGADVQCGG